MNLSTYPVLCSFSLFFFSQFFPLQFSHENKVTEEWEDHQNTQGADEGDENEGQEAEGEYLQVPENQDVPGKQ